MYQVKNTAVTSGAWTAVTLTGIRNGGRAVITLRAGGAFKHSHLAAPGTVYGSCANALTLDFKPSFTGTSLDEVIYIQSVAASDTCEVTLAM